MSGGLERDNGKFEGTFLEVDLFLPDLQSRHPNEFELMRLGGVHPEGMQGLNLINVYTGEVVNDSFDNVGRHCVSVAVYAGEIASGLQESGLSVNKDLAEIQALRHDASKGYEIMRRDAAKAGIDIEPYSEKAYDGIETYLINNGVNSEIARQMREAGSETGHNSLSSFLVLNSEGQPVLTYGDYERKIVHLADDMTASTVPKEVGHEITQFLTPRERMEAQRFRDRYPKLYRNGFGFNKDGYVVGVEDIEEPPEGLIHVKSFADWQEKVSNEICREFRNNIDPDHDEGMEPENWMKDFVNARVADKQRELSGQLSS